MTIYIENQLPPDYPEFTILGVLIKNFDITNYNHEKWEQEVQTLQTRLKNLYSLNDLTNDPIIQAYRQFYWKYVKVDPTKIRPASEALIRRVYRRGVLPNINPVVNAYNLASVETKIAMCAYDFDKIEGNLVFRLSQENEIFKGIGWDKEKNISSNLPIIADDNGIVSIYPYRDADRSKVTKSTTTLMLTVDGVPEISLNTLEYALKKAVNRIQMFCGGDVIENVIFENKRK